MLIRPKLTKILTVFGSKLPKPVDASDDLDDTLCMDSPLNIPNTDFPSDPSLQRLADDAMQRDYPEGFDSREAWDAYNEMLAEREASLEHRALHGDLDNGGN